MLDCEEERGHGLTPETDAALKADIARALEELDAEYGTVRLQLALTVFTTLMKHVDRNHGLGAYIEFLEEVGSSSMLTAGAIRELFEQDHTTDPANGRELH